MLIYTDNGQSITDPNGMCIPKAGGNGHYQQFLALQAASEAELVEPTGPTLAEVKATACARIEAKRQELEKTAVWVNWPDGVRSIIQTRDERDWRNINGVAARGLAHLMQGSSEDDWFRDANDVNHTLLPTQAVDMGYQAAAAVSALAKIAQDAKDAIRKDTVTTEAEVVAIESAIVWPTS